MVMYRTHSKKEDFKEKLIGDRFFNINDFTFNDILLLATVCS